MIIIFEKKSQKIIGRAGKLLENGKYRECTVEELYPERHKELDFVVVDDDAPESKLGRGVRLKFDEKKKRAIGLEASSLWIKVEFNFHFLDNEGIPVVFSHFSPGGSNRNDQHLQISITIMDGKEPSSGVHILKLNNTMGELRNRLLRTTQGVASTELQLGAETGTCGFSIQCEDLPPFQQRIEVYSIDDRALWEELNGPRTGGPAIINPGRGL